MFQPEELKKDARERQQRSRDKKKRIPEPKPEPISVTSRKDDEKRKPAVQESFDSPQEAHGPAASPEDPKIGPSNLRNIFLMNCAASVQVARYEGPVDKEIRAAARRTAEAWKQLADEMERSGGGGP